MYVREGKEAAFVDSNDEEEVRRKRKRPVVHRHMTWILGALVPVTKGSKEDGKRGTEATIRGNCVT